MTNVLRHRGPDDGGFFLNQYRLRPPYEAMPGVALGHRRLSIIDVAGGHQPMCNEDETVWVVFNGEIYNFPSLRQRLEGAGHTFRTHGDTETIVHLYEDEGPDCFQHFNGMFAIAIWDVKQRQLVLGRDRLGQKPLVYRAEPGRLAFASELKSLLEIPGVPRDIDPNAVDEYLTYQYVPHPNSIFRGFRKLPPAHWAVFKDDKVHIQRYWQPDFNVQSTASHGEIVQQLRTTLSSAVKLRLQSEVPLGAFLSGGVDSSLMVALAQQHADKPLKTFSIGFPAKDYDETHFARLVANHLKTEHEEFQVTPDCVNILPELAWHYDEPFADSSAIPTWYVSKHTRQHVTVAISGDGGDELFAGYNRYKAVALAARLDRTWPLPAVFGARFWQSLPGSTRQKSLVRRFKRFCEVLRTPPERRYLDWIGIFREGDRADLYSDAFVERLVDSDPVSFLRQALAHTKQRDRVTAFSLADLVTYLPCDLNTKVDIASMAHSLECRQPFLDHRVVEFAASLPIHWKYRYGKGKRILREAFGDLLPKEIWTRPKMGFGVPLEDWFRDELRELTHDTLLDDTARNRDWFQHDVVTRLITEHESGQTNHSNRLWALLMFELWMRRWTDG